ncbi:cytochrome c oxidase assembly protein COX19 isoform X1 [Pteropus medius]|uniref:uncharacterized protein LOC120616032 isoform X1 n=1 Tax=Pteropus vampyrus TaxID=132908 RepID=UPI00196ADFBE|nr:uncharacterized protein LOC120616032 isoform X1 [Pteropus giganteus]
MGKSPADTPDAAAPAQPARKGQSACPGACCGLKSCVLGQVAEPLWARVSSSCALWGGVQEGAGPALTGALDVLGARRSTRSALSRPACVRRCASRVARGVRRRHHVDGHELRLQDLPAAAPGQGQLPAGPFR